MECDGMIEFVFDETASLKVDSKNEESSYLSSEESESLDGAIFSMIAAEERMERFSSSLSNKPKKKIYYLSPEAKQPQQQHPQQCNRISKYQKPSLRILKTDIRRNYAFMLANVFNSYDYSLISSFFQRFCTSSLILRKKFYVSDGQGVMLKPINRDGVRSVADYFYANNLIAPDVIFRCGKTQIKASSDGSAELLSHVRILGTRMYDINSSDIVDFIEGIYENEKQLAAAATNYAVYSHPLFDDYWRNNVRRLAKPVSFHIDGLISLSLNDKKQIQRIKFRSFYSYV